MQKSQTIENEAKEFSGIFIKIEDHPCSHYEASKAALRELIAQTKEKVIHKDYESKISDNEILGILISKYAKFDFNEIEEITKHAFEDSNFKVKIEDCE